MKKKILTLTLIASMVFSFAGCGETKNEDIPASVSTYTQVSTEDKSMVSAVAETTVEDSITEESAYNTVPEEFDYSVSVSINPQITFYFEGFEIISWTFDNDDAKEAFAEVDFKGLRQEDAIFTVLRITSEKGYLKENGHVNFTVNSGAVTLTTVNAESIYKSALDYIEQNDIKVSVSSDLDGEKVEVKENVTEEAETVTETATEVKTEDAETRTETAKNTASNTSAGSTERPDETESKTEGSNAPVSPTENPAPQVLHTHSFHFGGISYRPGATPCTTEAKVWEECGCGEINVTRDWSTYSLIHTYDDDWIVTSTDLLRKDVMSDSIYGTFYDVYYTEHCYRNCVNCGEPDYWDRVYGVEEFVAKEPVIESEPISEDISE